MTLTIILAALAVAALPIMLARVWNSRRKVVYQGIANPITGGLEDLGQRTNTRYCWFEVADGTRYLAEISIDRHAELRFAPDPATITVVQYPLNRAEVESVLWHGETAIEPTEQGAGGALLFSGIYLLAGLGAMALGFHFNEVLTGNVAMIVSAVMLALSGFALTLMHGAKPKLSEISGRMLGIPIGKGLVSLLVILAVSLGLTVACFSSISFFAFFPGIHAAFALGSVIALWWKSRHSA